MSKFITSVSFAAVLALAAGSALGNGVTRSPDLNTNNHSAFGIGANAGAFTGGFGYGSTPGVFQTNNPSNTTKPYSATGSTQDAFLFTDVTTAQNAGAYGNELNGGRNSVSQLGIFHWYVNAGASTARFAPNGSASTAATSFTQSYTNNTSVVVMNNIGNSTTNFSLRIETTLTDGSNGQSNVYSVATITRNSAGSGNASPITLSLGSLVGLDIGAGSASDTLSDVSGSGEARVRFTDGLNFGEAVGFGVSSWAGGQATGSGSLDTALTGSGALTSAIVNATPTDAAAGFLWNVTLNAVGDSASVALAFSINQSAVPAPGAAALVGLGGLLAARRRRA